MAAYGSKEYDKLSPAAELIACILTDGTRIRHPRVKSLPLIAFGSDAGFFETILEVAATGEDPNPRNVAVRQRQKGWPPDCGGLPRLERLAMPMPWEQSFDETLNLVEREYERDELYRRTIALSKKILAGDAIEGIKSAAQDQIAAFEVNQSHGPTTADLAQQAYVKALKPIEGIAHGLPGLADIRPVLEYGHLTTLAAYMKFGKSTAIRQIVREVGILQKVPVAYACLEDQAVSSVMALMYALAEVPRHIRGASLTSNHREDLKTAARMIAESPITVIESNNIWEIIAKTKECGAAMLVVDQMSEVTGLDESKFRRSGGGEDNLSVKYGEYAKHLRTAARDLGISVLLVVQLAEYKRKPGKRPGKGDIQDSNRIGQHCDQLVILWEDDSDDATRFGRRYVIMELDRHGPVGMKEVVVDLARGVYRNAVL